MLLHIYYAALTFKPKVGIWPWYFFKKDNILVISIN